MTQEPDTQQEHDGQAQPDPFALLVQASEAARRSLDNAVHNLAARFAETAGAQENHATGHTEALTRLQTAAEAIHEAFTAAAAKTAKELGHLKQQAATYHETTGKRIIKSTTALSQRFDDTDARLEEISDSQTEHYRLTGAVLEKVSPLPEDLHDYANATREQIEQLAQSTAAGQQALSADLGEQISALPDTVTSDGAQTREQLEQLAATAADQQALSAHLGEQISALPDAITSDGAQTREQLGAALALLRSALDAIAQTGTDVRGVENALGMVIGAARDQILQPLHQHAEYAAGAAKQHTTRLDQLHHLLEGAADQQTSHGIALEKIAEDTDRTARELPRALSQTLDALAASNEETRRTVLEVEGRVSAALALTSERAEQALTSIAGDLGHFANAFEAFAEKAASTGAVESLRGDVSALSELLAGSTEDFSEAVQQAVSDMAAMRTAWAQESAQMLQSLENMGRMFAEKANASEHARDRAVIELGRRVAKLELTRAPAAIGS